MFFRLSSPRPEESPPLNKIKPFVLNSNLPDDRMPIPFEQIMQEMAGNSGNTYITYSMLKTLGLSDSLTPQQHVKNIWREELPDAEYINANYTHCLFTLQDQFQAQIPNYIPPDKAFQITKFIDKLRIPLIAYSLGTNFAAMDTVRLVCPELHPLLNAISSKSVCIGVRGEITREALAKIGITNTTVIGCPTYFEAGRDRKIRKE